MVAKKTAVQQSASGRSTRTSGDAARDVGGKKSTRTGTAPDAAETVRTVRATAGQVADRATAGGTKKPAAGRRTASGGTAAREFRRDEA